MWNLQSQINNLKRMTTGGNSGGGSVFVPGKISKSDLTGLTMGDVFVPDEKGDGYVVSESDANAAPRPIIPEVGFSIGGGRGRGLAGIVSPGGETAPDTKAEPQKKGEPEAPADPVVPAAPVVPEPPAAPVGAETPAPVEQVAPVDPAAGVPVVGQVLNDPAVGATGNVQELDAIVGDVDPGLADGEPYFPEENYGVEELGDVGGGDLNAVDETELENVGGKPKFFRRNQDLHSSDPGNIETFSKDTHILSPAFEGHTKIVFEGALYPSILHAFMASRTLDLRQRKVFQVDGWTFDDGSVGVKYKTADAAFRKGMENLRVRPDWNQVKDQILRDLINQRFDIVEANGRRGLTPSARYLHDTGDAVIEGNYKWIPDGYTTMLMQRRREIQNEVRRDESIYNYIGENEVYEPGVPGGIEQIDNEIFAVPEDGDPALHEVAEDIAEAVVRVQEGGATTRAEATSLERVIAKKIPMPKLTDYTSHKDFMAELEEWRKLPEINKSDRDMAVDKIIAGTDRNDPQFDVRTKSGRRNGRAIDKAWFRHVINRVNAEFMAGGLSAFVSPNIATAVANVTATATGQEVFTGETIGPSGNTIIYPTDEVPLDAVDDFDDPSMGVVEPDPGMGIDDNDPGMGVVDTDTGMGVDDTGPDAGMSTDTTSRGRRSREEEKPLTDEDIEMMVQDARVAIDYLESKLGLDESLRNILVKARDWCDVLEDTEINWEELPDISEAINTLRMIQGFIQLDASRKSIKETPMKKAIDDLDAALRSQFVEKQDETIPWSIETVRMNRDNIQRDLSRGTIKIKGQIETKQKVATVNSKDEPDTREVTHIKYPPNLVRAMSVLMTDLGYKDPTKFSEEYKIIFRAVQLYRSLSIGADGKWFKDGAKELELTEMEVIEVINEWRVNIAETGYPFAYRKVSTLRDSERYPMPMTPSVANFFMRHIENSRWHEIAVEKGMISSVASSPGSKLVLAGIIQHNTMIVDIISKMPSAQRWQMLNMVDAILEKNPSMAGESQDRIHLRTESELISLTQLLSVEDSFDGAELDPKLIEINAKHRARLMKDWQYVESIKKKYELEEYRRWQNFWQATNDIAITNALTGLGGGGLAVSGTIEKRKGLWDVQLAMAWVGKMRERRAKKNPDKFIDPTPTDWLLEFFGEDRMVEAVQDAYSSAGGSAGMRGVRAMAMDPDYVFGQDAFVKEEDDSDSDGEKKPRRKTFKQKVGSTSEFMIKASTGDWFGSKEMARIWLRAYLMNVAESHRIGGKPMTPADVEALLRNQDPDQWFKEAMKTPEGQDALAVVSKTSIAGFNIFTAAIGSVLNTPGKQAAFGFAVTRFPKYSTNSLLLHAPAATTVMYLTKMGLNKATEGKKVNALGKEWDGTEWGDATDAYVPGGMYLDGEKGSLLDDPGLQQAIIMDIIRNGTDAAIIAIVGLVLSKLGVEPPEDERLVFNFNEWKISGKPIKLSWFWNDLMRFTMPLLIGIFATQHAEELGYGKMELFWNIFNQGMWNGIEGNMWIRMSSVTNLITNFSKEYQTELNRYEGSPDLELDNFLAMGIRSWLVDRTMASIEPALAREIYTENGIFGGTADYDVSTTKVFTTKVSDESWETEMTSYEDSRWRRDVKNSPGLGLLSNLITGYYAAEPEVDRTGYMRQDMPRVTNVDQANQYWVDKLSPKTLDGTLIEFEADAYKDWAEDPQWAPIVTEVRRLMDMDMTAQELTASGVVIPYNARLATERWYDLEAQAIWEDFNDRQKSGEWSVPKGSSNEVWLAVKAARSEAYEEAQAATQALKDKSDKMWSDIPYSAARMQRRRTSFETYQVYAEGHPKAGQPIGWLEGMMNPELVEERLYPYGDDKSSWMPYARPKESEPHSFDFRSTVPWHNDLTNDEFVESEYSGKIIESGLGSGEDLYDVMTGYGATGPNATRKGDWEQNEYLWALRAYDPEIRNETPKERPKWDWDDKQEDPSTKTTDDGSGSGYGGYGGGGGGGGYAPNIYSRPGYNINVDKPAGLYSKTKNYTKFDFLRPSVQTKGSREAYRREDF